MRPSRTGSSPGRQALIEAADWFVDFRAADADGATREDFNRWVRRSPENIQAYLQIATTWADLSAAKPANALDVQRHIDAAQSQRNVVSLGGDAREPRAATPRRWAHSFLLAAMLAGILIGSALLLRGLVPAYSTGIGEQRFVTLSDGSTLQLNARSSVRVRFSERHREVELLSGQALFDIVKDPARPFVVRSGATRIRAVGTQFDVYRRSSGTTVTVLEGRVAVSSGASVAPVPVPSAPDESPVQSPGAAVPPAFINLRAGLVYLSAGERLIVTPSRALAPVTTDVATATAWTQRRLIFESSRLTDVAEEFNRYNRRPLRVEPGELEKMLISGVYSSTDPASLLRFLRHQPGVEVTETEEEIRVHVRPTVSTF